MTVQYLDKPCTRCGKRTVTPPLKADLAKPRILVPCDSCGKYSRYNIQDHVDGTLGYWLSAWGRRATGNDYVRKTVFIKKEQATWSTGKIRRALDSYKGK